MKGKKALLLNPPGSRKYIRDYYCSKLSKSGYLFHPIDLLMLSGRLSERFELAVIDAIVDGLSVDNCIGKVLDEKPDVIVWLAGIVSWHEDRAFMKRLKGRAKFVSICSGDLFLENGRQRLEESSMIDAAVLDFSSDDLTKFLDGDLDVVNNLIYRFNGKVEEAPVSRSKREEFILPIPRHDLFLNNKYHFTFSKRRQFATVLTDFGCPYKCSFCIMGNLGFKYRNIQNVIEELKFIKKLKVGEVFFADQTFGAVKERNRELCEKMISEKMDFGWTCFSRVDVVDEPTLKLWKKAGCHTIIFGVETASEELLKAYRKGYTKRMIKETFEISRRLGIQTVGTFILGLPEETEESARGTIEFAKKIDCDFFSFNFAVPRYGTMLRRDSIERGLATEENISMDQSGQSISMPSDHLSKDQIKEIRRKVIRDFYLRPSYLWRRLISVKSPYQLWNQVREGIYLIRSIIGRDFGERAKGK